MVLRAARREEEGSAETIVIQLVERLYQWLICAGSSLKNPFLLAIRLYWGWQLVESGWGKLTHLAKVTAYFTSLGLPMPAMTARFVSTLELVSGILLILGLASRLISVPLVINLIVAYITADRDALLSFFSDPGKFYNADEFTFLFVALIVLIFGPGLFSLDAWIARRIKPRAAACSAVAPTAA